MGDDREQPRVNSRAWALVALHVLLFIYSFTGFFSKNAARQPVMSFEFFAYYAGMLAILLIYAIGWQQILKRLPLTLAFANKAITVVWGIVWGAVFFNETITWQMIVGAIIVMAGLVLFAIADSQEQAALPADGGDAPGAEGPPGAADALPDVAPASPAEGPSGASDADGGDD